MRELNSWFEVRSKTNANAGSIRLQTAVDSAIVVQLRQRFKAAPPAIDPWAGDRPAVGRDRLQPPSPAHRDPPTPVALASSGVSPADLGWMSVGTSRPRADADSGATGQPLQPEPTAPAPGPPDQPSSPAHSGQGGTPRHGKGATGTAELQRGNSYIHSIPTGRPDAGPRTPAVAPAAGGDPPSSGGEDVLKYKVGDMIGKGSFGKVRARGGRARGRGLAARGGLWQRIRGRR